MLTLLLILIPLFAPALFWVLKEEKIKVAAFIVSIFEFALGCIAYYLFRTDSSSPLLSLNLPWIPQVGINFSISLDGISLVLVLLSVLLVPFIILSSFDSTIKNLRTFYALMLTMQSALVGVFAATDGLLFYVFWELALIPIYFICLLWGGSDRIRVTFKFFIYTLAGSLFMLAALIYIYNHTPVDARSFNINELYNAASSLSSMEQGWIFWAFFIAFAIKMPVFPFHTWQPDTYTTAPMAGTMLLSGIMLKMGTYGLIRWLIPMVPQGSADWASWAIWLSVISIVYASLLALAQKDFKRLIAYSSIAHVGLISAGILSFTAEGVQGAMLQMFSHGINVVGLFFICQIIEKRTDSRLITELGGIRMVAPKFSLLFLIVLLGSVALPLTNGFVGEFLLINGLFQFSAWAAAFGGLTVILGAVYMLRGYQSIILGDKKTITANFAEPERNEMLILIPIVVLILLLGVFPGIVGDISIDAVNILVQKVIIVN